MPWMRGHGNKQLIMGKRKNPFTKKTANLEEAAGNVVRVAERGRTSTER